MNVSPQQIAIQAGKIHKDDQRAKFILLHLPADDFADKNVDVLCDGVTQPWPVHACRSPLAVRAAMNEQAKAATPVVLTYAGDDAELGWDVLARCAKRRSHLLDIWQTVLTMFHAARLDERLRKHRWLAELLVRNQPNEGYAPVRSLMLDQARAWREVLRQVMGLRAFPPDDADLLAWASDARNRERFAALSEAARQGIAERLVSAELLGELTALVFAAIAAGRGDDLLAAAMLCESLAPGAEGEFARDVVGVTARLESLFGGAALKPEILKRLSAAAKDWADDKVPADERELHLARFEALVVEMKAEKLAARASYGRLAQQENLADFAAAVAESAAAPAAAALAKLRAMRWPTLNEATTRRCEMACRLLNWLASASAPAAKNLRELAEQYRHELAWVDWAQNVLFEGDDHPALAAAFAALREKVQTRRSSFDERFATVLAKGIPTGERPLPIERALDAYVAPVAAAGRCLVVVMDGMSLSVFLELDASLRAQGWFRFDPAGREDTTLLTMLPSTTAASRTSLLSGKATLGNADAESAAFARHPALLAHSRAGRPPLLFHKGKLFDPGRASLSDDLRSALRDANRRVVGIVLNAVDDHLAKSDQLRLRWDVSQLKGLDALLAEARSTERRVILTSDHGHVIEQGSEMKSAGKNQRWREPNLESWPGEILLTGPRVKAACGLDKAVLAWSAHLRYAPKANGYHGGCSPAEALVPMVTYQPEGKAEAGWSAAEETAPGWWDK
jgi:hypothetical protein